MKKLRDLLYKVRGGAVKVIYPKYSKDSNESCNFDVFELIEQWLKSPKNVPNHCPEHYPPKENMLRGVISDLVH